MASLLLGPFGLVIAAATNVGVHENNQRRIQGARGAVQHAREGLQEKRIKLEAAVEAQKARKAELEEREQALERAKKELEGACVDLSAHEVSFSFSS